MAICIVLTHGFILMALHGHRKEPKISFTGEFEENFFSGYKGHFA